MQDRIHGAVEIDVLRDVVQDEAELPVPEEVSDVPFVARDEIVEADDLVPFGEEAVGQMAPEESRGSGDDDTHETAIVRGPRQGTAFLVLPPSGVVARARYACSWE